MAPVNSDPVALLSELLDCLAAGRVPPDDVRQWLADGIHGVVAGRRLDTCLGLVKCGQPPIRARLVQLRVDQYLCRAIEAAPMVGSEPSWWDRCRTLAPLLSRYLAGSWRHHRHLAEPPGGVAAWQLWAWYAAELDPALPCTPRGLYTVLQRAWARQLHAAPSTLLAHLMSQPCHDPHNDSLCSAPSGPT